MGHDEIVSNKKNTESKFYFGDNKCAEASLVFVELPTEGDAERNVELTWEGEDALVLFCHGAELQEPVVAHGPFVMNTEDEIWEAYAEYQAGKFGRV